MVEDALKQYFETGEISVSSMLVGTLTEVGMGNLISEKYVKESLRGSYKCCKCCRTKVDGFK